MAANPAKPNIFRAPVIRFYFVLCVIGLVVSLGLVVAYHQHTSNGDCSSYAHESAEGNAIYAAYIFGFLALGMYVGHYLSCVIQSPKKKFLTILGAELALGIIGTVAVFATLFVTFWCF